MPGQLPSYVFTADSHASGNREDAAECIIYERYVSY
jgi:hypothetical protein